MTAAGGARRVSKADCRRPTDPMQELAQMLDDVVGADDATPARGVEERIQQLALLHPDNIHLTTFDREHFLSMSLDEQSVFSWCLETDLVDLRNQHAADGSKTQMPATAFVAVVLCAVALLMFGVDAVMPLVVSLTFGSIALAFVVPGRSSSAEELAEERAGHQLPQVMVSALRAATDRLRAKATG